ncbi:hypothetical protein ACLX1H_011167 [Fusarium chlamydosporum]
MPSRSGAPNSSGGSSTPAETTTSARLYALCCREIGRISYSMPLLYFAGLLNNYGPWIQANSSWMTPFMYHRIRTNISDVVEVDRLDIEPTDAVIRYCVLAAISGSFLRFQDDLERVRRENSD